MLRLLLVLTITVTPLATSFRLNTTHDEIWSNETPAEVHETNSRNKHFTVSIKDFGVFNKLGQGVFSDVYVAKKIGGSDDGQLYALKAMEIADAMMLDENHQDYNKELEMMKILKTDGVPFSLRLHYAFRDRNWLFLVMDLVTGGIVGKRFLSNEVDAATAKVMVTELIVAVEGMHKANILHLDLHDSNVLVDSDGHLVVIDYGASKWRSDNIDEVRLDWEYISEDYSRVYQPPYDEALPRDVFDLLSDMTDAQVPELKSHPFFADIDWDRVAARDFPAPFPANKTEIVLIAPKNVSELFKSDIDDELAAKIAENFPNYSFVAPEHQY